MIDEHDVFRRGVVAILSDERCLEVIVEAAEGPVPDDAEVVVASPRAFARFAARRPVVVCWGPSDPPLPGSAGSGVVIVEREAVTAEELLAAVRALAAGLRLESNSCSVQSCNDSLDWRCRHILQLLADGADTRHISHSLCYSERTIKALISGMEDQLSARTRAQAVAKGIRLGII